MKKLTEWVNWINKEIEEDEKREIPELKKLTKIVHFVDYSDFEHFAEKVYNLNHYSFAEVGECSNDTDYTFSTNGHISRWDIEEAEKIRNGGPVLSNHTLFDVLVADGYLEKGTYVVRVSW